VLLIASIPVTMTLAIMFVAEQLRVAHVAVTFRVTENKHQQRVCGITGTTVLLEGRDRRKSL
jgi:hypothetical protein